MVVVAAAAAAVINNAKNTGWLEFKQGKKKTKKKNATHDRTNLKVLFEHLDKHVGKINCQNKQSNCGLENFPQQKKKKD